MQVLYRIIRESIDQAFQQLVANKLRSFLSLLGITVGIFCIIAVMSAVDSLEDNIRGSFEQLGDDVIYISKLPWNEDPNQSYWKYFQRPVPDIEDYEVIKTRVKSVDQVSLRVILGSRTIKHRSNSVEGAFVIAATHEFGDIFKMQFENGRYFTMHEYESGSNRILLGYTIAEELFGTVDPVGKTVKLMGKNMQVIGVIEKAGDALVNPLDYDNTVVITYTLARQVADVRMENNPWANQLNIKAGEGFTVDELRDEVTGVLRAHRRLKPKENNDFSVNEMSIIADALDSIFGVLNLAGFVIGIFAILVGMFSVANIMFVSVKERTKLIGIKKAIGAKKNFILLEFLIEAVVLCLFGGVLGLLLVFSFIEAFTFVTLSVGLGAGLLGLYLFPHWRQESFS